MNGKFKLIDTFSTGNPNTVLGIVLSRFDDNFIVDFRYFEKAEEGLRATPRGMIFRVENVPDLVKTLLRAAQAADMWAFLAEEENSNPKGEKRRNAGQADKKNANGVVVQFPKGNGKDHHPEI